MSLSSEIQSDLAPDTTEPIASVQPGENWALAARVYPEEVGPLLAHIIRTTRDSSFAEDLAQETFIRFGKSEVAFDEKRGVPIGAFLRHIGSRVIVDHYRQLNRLKRGTEVLLPNPSSAEVFDGSTDFADRLVDRLTQAECLASVQGIVSPEQAAVLKLFAESYTQDEIAEELNIAVGTVKSRKYRGLQLLREALDGNQ